jgi:hypothetical protein
LLMMRWQRNQVNYAGTRLRTSERKNFKCHIHMTSVIVTVTSQCKLRLGYGVRQMYGHIFIHVFKFALLSLFCSPLLDNNGL